MFFDNNSVSSVGSKYKPRPCGFESRQVLLFKTLKGIQVVCDSITGMFFVHQVLGPNIFRVSFCCSVNSINIQLNFITSSKAKFNFKCIAIKTK